MVLDNPQSSEAQHALACLFDGGNRGQPPPSDTVRVAPVKQELCFAQPKT